MTIEERLTNIENLLGHAVRLLSASEPKQSEERKFYNIEEASKATGISKTTLRCYCNRGLLKFTKVGHRDIIHADSLEEYMRTNAREVIKKQADEVNKTLKGFGYGRKS